MRWEKVSVALTLMFAAGTAGAGDVPNVAVGPELKDRAPRLDAPIEEVTVYSDRARIVRRARFTAKAGLDSVRLPDLTGAVLLDSVRVAAKGARVIRAEARPMERERISIEQVDELLDRLEALMDQVRVREEKLAVERSELELLGRVQPAPPVPEKDRDGRRALPVSTDAWFESVGFLSKRDRESRARIQALEREVADLREKQSAVTQEIQKHNLGAFTSRQVEVFVLVETQAARKVDLELEYVVPGARWKPTYDLRFDGERLTVETSAMVQQATGEDWTDVALHLSTAIPGQGIDMPELLTWTLGEAREFLPKPRPAQARPTPPRHAAPSARPTRLEQERAVELEILRERFARLSGQSLGAVRSDSGYSRPPARPRPPSRAEPSMQRPQDDVVDLESPRPVARPLAETTSVERDSVGFGSSAPQYVYKNLALFEPAPQRQTFSDPYLPAVTAGGLDYVYEAPTRATITSSGDDQRVPLVVETFGATTLYEATPSLDTTAYVKAKVRNAGKRPLLRGPTSIFVGGEFVGQGEIATTGPGGVIGFPLGADENVRLVRTVVPQTKTEGFISKDDVTTYTVEIQIGNYKKSPITIEVIDQIPKTRHEDVEVELKGATPQPLPHSPDTGGIMRWRLNVPAGKTRTIKFSYEIERPADWQLYQH